MDTTVDNMEPEQITFLDESITIIERTLDQLKQLREKMNIESPIIMETNKIISQIARDVSEVKRSVV